MLTPLSPLPFVGFTVTLAGVVVVEAIPAPFSNTKEVIFTNSSTTDRVFAQVVDVSAGLPAALMAANSVVIPPGMSVTFCIGPEGERQPLATSAFWLANPGANLNIVFQAELGVPDVELNVVYVQCRGGGGA